MENKNLTEYELMINYCNGRKQWIQESAEGTQYLVIEGTWDGLNDRVYTETKDAKGALTVIDYAMKFIESIKNNKDYESDKRHFQIYNKDFKQIFDLHTEESLEWESIFEDMENEEDA